MRVNGKDVDNSNTEQITLDPSFTSVLVSQGVAGPERGDKVTVVFSGSETKRGTGRQKPAGVGGAKRDFLWMEDRLNRYGLESNTKCND
jgi:hypothetical protein